METMAISKFKATCLAVLERVRKTGKPLRITKRGKPIADILPPKPDQPKKRIFGKGRGMGRILGDIISPAAPLEDYDIFRQDLLDER